MSVRWVDGTNATPTRTQTRRRAPRPAGDATVIGTSCTRAAVGRGRGCQLLSAGYASLARGHAAAKGPSILRTCSVEGDGEQPFTQPTADRGTSGARRERRPRRCEQASSPGAKAASSAAGRVLWRPTLRRPCAVRSAASRARCSSA
jgi:hypothetical protein